VLIKWPARGAVGTLRGGGDGDDHEMSEKSSSTRAAEDTESSSEDDSESDRDVGDDSSEEFVAGASGGAADGSSGVRGPVEDSGLDAVQGAGVSGKASHQAAFGIPVPSERAAALVNAALTAACTLVVAIIQAYYKYRGKEPPNPIVMELTMNSFRICLAFQTCLALYLYSEGLPKRAKAFVTDLTGGGNPPKSKEEALERRRRQMRAMKAFRTISTAVVMLIWRMVRPSSLNPPPADDGGMYEEVDVEGVEGGRQAEGGGATAGGLAGVWGGVCSHANTAWMSLLEVIFTASGDEVALAGIEERFERCC
jgi:hypothetical protein